MIIEKILVFWLTVTFNEADDKVRTSVHCRQLVESTSTSCVNFTSPNYCFLSDPQSRTKFAKIHKLGQGNGHFLALKNWPNIWELPGATNTQKFQLQLNHYYYTFT